MSATKVGVLHPGTQHSWQTALALQEADLLGWYATTIFYDANRWPYKLERHLPAGLAERASRTLRRRYHPDLDPQLVRRRGRWGWVTGALPKALPRQVNAWVGRTANREFGKSVVALLEREPVDIVWAYDSAALEVFRWAKRHGVTCVLDRTTCHSALMNSALAEEYARHPQFFSTPFVPKPRHQLDEEQEELELADAVLVGSSYAASSLIDNGVARAKIRLLPYGYDECLFPEAFPVRTLREDAPIEFLFVGRLAPHKGVAYLLEAFAQIPATAAALTLVGPMAIPERTFAKYRDRVRHIPQVSRQEVAALMSRADCFLYPSLFEGGPFVLREIYGAGLGAVQTRSAGEGVRDRRNGIILERHSVSEIVDSVERILADRDCLARWQSESWAARHECGWTWYRHGVREFLTGLAAGDSPGATRMPQRQRMAAAR